MFVTFATLWLVLFWGFRGDTGAIKVCFPQEIVEVARWSTAFSERKF